MQDDLRPYTDEDDKKYIRRKIDSIRDEAPIYVVQNLERVSQWDERYKDLAVDVLSAHVNSRDLNERLFGQAHETKITLGVDYLDKAVENFPYYDKHRGLKVGIPKLDNEIKGLRPGSVYVLVADTNVGKAISKDTLVATPTGYIPIKDLSQGDTVLDGNGEPTKIKGYYPQGVRPCYEVEFHRGEKIIADDNHLWTVMTNTNWRSPTNGRGEPNKNYKKWSTKTTKELAGYRGRPMRIPSASMKLPEADLAIDPYVLGVLLGDGNMQTRKISNPEQHILKQIISRGYIHGSIRDTGSCLSYTITNIHDQIRSLGYDRELSHEKFVPHQYLWASEDQRLDMLRGLMDTDGSVAPKGTGAEFSTSSPHLSEAVNHLVQSLGGHCKTAARKTWYTYKGERKQGKPSYRTTLYLPVNPFTLPSKADRYSKKKHRNSYRKIKSITPIEPRETICIAVESDTKQFIIEHGIVTHNTFLALNMALGPLKDKKFVYYMNLEMLNEDMVERFMRVTGSDPDKNPEPTELCMQTLPFLAFHEHTDSRIKHEDIRSILDKATEQTGASLAIIDHLHYFKSANDKSEREAIDEAMAEIKAAAIDLSIPIIVISHITKHSQEDRVKQSNIKGSSAIAQDADQVWIINRDLDKGDINKRTFMITKNREGSNMFKDIDFWMDKGRVYQFDYQIDNPFKA